MCTKLVLSQQNVLRCVRLCSVLSEVMGDLNTHQLGGMNVTLQVSVWETVWSHYFMAKCCTSPVPWFWSLLFYFGAPRCRFLVHSSMVPSWLRNCCRAWSVPRASTPAEPSSPSSHSTRACILSPWGKAPLGRVLTWSIILQRGRLGWKSFLFDFIGKGQSFLRIQLDVLSGSQPAAIWCFQNGVVMSQESLTSSFHLPPTAGGLGLSTGALICEKLWLPAFFHTDRSCGLWLVTRAQLCSLSYPINFTWTHYIYNTDGICPQIQMFQVPNSSFIPATPVFGHFWNLFSTSGWKVAGGCASLGQESWHRPTVLALVCTHAGVFS